MKKTILILALTGIITLSAAPPPAQTVVITIPAKPKGISITTHGNLEQARDFVYTMHHDGYLLKSFAPKDGHRPWPDYVVIMEKY